MKQNYLFLMAAIIVLNSNTIYSQEKITPPKNQVDSVSYAIGMDIAKGFESEFIEFNIDQFIHGLTARIASDKEPIFSDKEAQEMVRDFFQTKRGETVEEATDLSSSIETMEEATDVSTSIEIESISDTTVRIGNLVVMRWDLGKDMRSNDLQTKKNQMEWVAAQKACAALGNGWRLPTIKELDLLYHNKDEIGGFNWNSYWSSSLSDFESDAWSQNFIEGVQSEANIINELYVRAVRTIYD